MQSWFLPRPLSVSLHAHFSVCVCDPIPTSYKDRSPYGDEAHPSDFILTSSSLPFFFFFFKFKTFCFFIYSFFLSFICWSGSLLLCTASSFAHGGTPSCDAWPPHHSGSSCDGEWVLGTQASGLAPQPVGTRPRIEHMSPAVTTESPRLQKVILWLWFYTNQSFPIRFSALK